MKKTYLINIIYYGDASWIIDRKLVYHFCFTLFHLIETTIHWFGYDIFDSPEKGFLALWSPTTEDTSRTYDETLCAITPCTRVHMFFFVSCALCCCCCFCCRFWYRRRCRWWWRRRLWWWWWRCARPHELHLNRTAYTFAHMRDALNFSECFVVRTAMRRRRRMRYAHVRNAHNTRSLSHRGGESLNT